MSGGERLQSRRTRAVLGIAVVAVSGALAAGLAGIGFAGSSISLAQYQYGKKTICHHTKSAKNPTVTITISEKAWPAHQKHGDTPGACATPNKGKGKGKGKNKPPVTTTTTTTTTAATPGPPPDKGKGKGKGKGK